MSYHYNGKIKDSAFYSNGKPIDKSLSWYPNGFQQDSICYYGGKGGVATSWFDNGNPNSFGRFTESNKPSGKWSYFHKNGKISAIEIYSDSKLVDSKFYDENGLLMVNSNKDASTVFPKGKKLLQNTYRIIYISFYLMDSML